MTSSHSPKLSICIATFERAHFIGQTLESIGSQLTGDCEIVILDGGSKDGTEEVVSEYVRRFPAIRYFRQEVNHGLDQDFDKAVLLARGEYCWLMSDDDFIKPGAIRHVLALLASAPSLIVVNFECRDREMRTVVQKTFLGFDDDRRYGPEEMDRLFTDVSGVIAYIGSVIIRREIWESREREKYFGSMFGYVGVIFQNRLPGETILVASTMVSFRSSTRHTFESRLFEVFFFKWPAVFWPSAVSEKTRMKVCPADRWRNWGLLCLYRALDLYSFAEYRRLIQPCARPGREKWMPALIAVTPASLINGIIAAYLLVIRKPVTRYLLYLLLQAPSSPLRRQKAEFG